MCSRRSYGPAGTYGDNSVFDRSYQKSDYGDAFLKMAAKRPSKEAVDYAKEICNYIYDTYGRFPAHTNAFHLPGVWLQFSHLEMEFYDSVLRSGSLSPAGGTPRAVGDH